MGELFALDAALSKRQCFTKSAPDCYQCVNVSVPLMSRDLRR